MAERIGIREFKNRATEIIRRVRAGHEYVITVNGQPAATLKPLEDRPKRSREEIEHDLRVLERIKAFAASAGPGSVVDALIADREERDRVVTGRDADGRR